MDAKVIQNSFIALTMLETSEDERRIWGRLIRNEHLDSVPFRKDYPMECTFLYDPTREAMFALDDWEFYPLRHNDPEVDFDENIPYIKLEFNPDEGAKYEIEMAGYDSVLEEKWVLPIIKVYMEQSRITFRRESKTYLLLFHQWSSGPDMDGEYDGGYEFVKHVGLSEI